jgi:Cytochrome P460
LRAFLLLPIAALLAAMPFVNERSSAAAGYPPNNAMWVPQYDAGGALLRPKNFEHWTFIGSNIGMSYDPGEHKGPGEFHNIYMQPEAFDNYRASGKFPEQTTFLLAVYQPAQKVSINTSGYFEGEMTGLAASVKDASRFKEGWGYFSFGEGGDLTETAKVLPKEMCFACHDQHADDDHVFVQFHTVLRQVRHKSLP